jgi:hypothetical protein
LSKFQDGVLPAAFMIGLLIASLVFSELCKYYNAFRLIGELHQSKHGRHLSHMPCCTELHIACKLFLLYGSFQLCTKELSVKTVENPGQPRITLGFSLKKPKDVVFSFLTVEMLLMGVQVGVWLSLWCHLSAVALPTASGRCWCVESSWVLEKHPSST